MAVFADLGPAVEVVAALLQGGDAVLQLQRRTSEEVSMLGLFMGLAIAALGAWHARPLARVLATQRYPFQGLAERDGGAVALEGSPSIHEDTLPTPLLENDCFAYRLQEERHHRRHKWKIESVEQDGVTFELSRHGTRVLVDPEGADLQYCKKQPFNRDGSSREARYTVEPEGTVFVLGQVEHDPTLASGDGEEPILIGDGPSADPFLVADAPRRTVLWRLARFPLYLFAWASFALLLGAVFSPRFA